MLNIYRASAGSGKTYRLTRDYIALLFEAKSKQPHRRILAVTFTNKATEEMKERILKELHALATGKTTDFREFLAEKTGLQPKSIDEIAKKLLVELLHDYSFFAISTIDRFFQQVIRAFAREIGVDGAYNIELNNSLVMQQAADNLFLNLSENHELLNWLTDFAENSIEEGKSWNIKNQISTLGKEIFKENYQQKAEQTREKLHDRAFLKNYKSQLLKIKNDFETAVENEAKTALKTIEIHGLQHEDFAYAQTKKLEKIIDGEYELGSRLLNFAQDTSKGYTKKAAADIVEKIERAHAGGLQKNLQNLQSLFESEKMIFYNSSTLILQNINTLGILTDLGAEIKMLMEEQNTMLLSDANMLLCKIIGESDTPFVYERTGIHIDHFMIDEFQDTSALQYKNFLPLLHNSLASGNFNLLVGDVKQSIYRWRNSDWKLLDNQVLTDFNEQQRKIENLDTNYRSDHNIVEFNNQVFSISPSILEFSEQKSILHAYENAEQKYKENADEGLVKIQFLSDESETNGTWKEQSLEKLPKILEDLQDRNFCPNNVGILVRTKDEARQVVEYLLHYKGEHPEKPYCYDLISNEGLQISASPAVRFIIGILRLFVNSADKIEEMLVQLEYLKAKKTPENQIFSTVIASKTHNDKIFQVFTADENARLAEIKNLNLFEMTEQIIALFNVGAWANAAVFVQAFQDNVFRFSSMKTASLSDFLTWWAENEQEQTIAVPDTQRAFRIMTIHKSKGLDFDAVIMPFCDWKLEEKANKAPVLWCEAAVEPFNQIPLLPVRYGEKLQNSIFAKNYFDEKLHQYVDNLNVMYVAFTRAKHELICFAPFSEKEKEDIKTISELLLYSICYSDLKKYFDENEKIFKFGIPVIADYDLQSAISKDLCEVNYAFEPICNRLKISKQNAWQSENEVVSYGLAMHDILRQIVWREDETRVLQSLILAGKLSADESAEIEKKLQQFWAISQTAEWFDPTAKILNEREIILPNGSIYRPDRVIIKNGKATVVDYKFGQEEKAAHTAQVKNYMQILAQMGYETTGAICYVKQAKVIMVNEP